MRRPRKSPLRWSQRVVWTASLTRSMASSTLRVSLMFCDLCRCSWYLWRSTSHTALCFLSCQLESRCPLGTNRSSRSASRWTTCLRRSARQPPSGRHRLWRPRCPNKPRRIPTSHSFQVTLYRGSSKGRFMKQKSERVLSFVPFWAAGFSAARPWGRCVHRDCFGVSTLMSC